MGSRKCGSFMSSCDRDPHPTCTRCRGRVCTRDMTCDFCVGWSPSQWEAFAKKRAYNDRKRSSRPSGVLPTAAATSSCAGTSSEVLRPEVSSSSSLPSGGQAKREGSRVAPCAASREASSPPARPRSSERGGSVSGRSSGARERASTSSAPSGAGKGEVACPQRASPHSSQHALQRGELGVFSGPLPFSILPCFPIFGSRNREGSQSPLSVGQLS